jgi:4-amino-4-deoxy-L-arabinose transferase-like glycosyltransferase
MKANSTAESQSPSPGRQQLGAIQRRWRTVLVGIVALALVLRMIYAVQIRNSPIPELWRGSQTDMHFFVEWAKVIAGGDWLTDRALHPYFAWQKPIGSRAQWDEWYGGKTFHQAPLYPYLLAFVFRFVGESLWTLYALQAITSGLTAVLIASITRRLFNPTAGLLAGVMTALYGPLLFYDFVALRTSLEVFSTALAIWLLISADSDDRRWRWLLAGAVFGLATLLRPNSLLMPVLTLPLLVILRWGRWRAVISAGGCLISGFCLVMMPLVARNAYVGAPPLTIEAVGASTFYLSNVSGAPGTGWGVIPAFPEAVRRTGGRFLPLAYEALKSHGSIASVLDLLGRKLAAVAHYFERSNNANLYYAERFSHLLKWATLPYWLVLPLGLAGLYVTWSQRRRLVWLYIAILAPLLTILLFYQTDRFRLPMMVGLIPPASAAVEWMIARRGNVPAVLAITIAICVLVRWPGDKDPPAVQTRDYQSGATVLLLAGQRDAAMAEAREAVRRFPEDAMSWLTLVRTLEATGQNAQAREAIDEGLKRVPAVDPHRDDLERLTRTLKKP